MQIQNGKLYKNRTLQYLYPCLNAYHKELKEKMNGFVKLGVGIGDNNMPGNENYSCIFILLNTETPLSNKVKYRENLDALLEWLPNQHYYVKDYMFSNISGTTGHMIVLKIPEVHEKSYLHFIVGEYSKMYDEKDIKNYFKDRKVTEEVKTTKSVLLREKAYQKSFVKIVNDRFKTNVDSYHFNEAELDFKPVLDEEIFNS